MNMYRYSFFSVRRRSLCATATILCFLILSLGFSAALIQAAQQDSPGRDIIAVFSLDGPVTEVPTEEVLVLFGSTGNSLHDVVTRLRKAADDDAVKAVVILPDSALLGSAQIEELRAAMALVRSHGKDVYVHADSLTMDQYVLASGASRISLVPTGPVLVPGLQASSLHLRGLLDKIGIKPDFITEGAYKSAAEIFTHEQPSPEADRMMNWLLDSWFDISIKLISEGRNVDPAKVQGWVDTGLFSADQAKAAGLIDAVEYRQEFEKVLIEKYGENTAFVKNYGRKKQAELDLSSPFSLLKIWSDLLRGPQKSAETRPAIALVYITGPILPGRSIPGPFGVTVGTFSTEIREALEKVAEDDSIKGVVLRVDSPGGSATASEIILDSTKRLKNKKALVVSMGDVAGSGGYYVACGADTIFADAATLTGSIGVLGGKLATKEMWNNIGITFKQYKRGQNAGIFSADDVFTESERAILTGFMDEIYGIFKKHVTDIRGDRLKKPIDELAGGRVYTGKQALELGLVDRLGTLNEAIGFAADEAKIKNYEVRIVPEPKPFLEQLIEQFSGGKETGKISLGSGQSQLINLAAPHLQNLDPTRVAAILSALHQLEIMQKEGVVLAMPQILLNQK